MKPYLRDHVPQKLSEIPDTTAFEAGYLVTKNAGWREQASSHQPRKVCGLSAMLFVLPGWRDIQRWRKGSH